MLSAMLPATVNVLGGDEETPVTYDRLWDGLQDTFRGTYTFDDKGGVFFYLYIGKRRHVDGSRTLQVGCTIGMENRDRQYEVERNRVKRAWKKRGQDLADTSFIATVMESNDYKKYEMRPQSLLYAHPDWEYRRKLIGYMAPPRDETQSQIGDDTAQMGDDIA
ncbi:hypothetical protein OHC33_008452 [Knufia fluminis]|uniref:Uncharacterized protein n=1 Tax=Knufia fluminis TaxID=191047 RepID=A0AAN8I3L6_9EURO|nr:hypothetical protein OHC33_008452 [Knufia fluminis]